MGYSEKGLAGQVPRAGCREGGWGEADQVRELIETLAYGPGNVQGLSSLEE
jgi:hypothetical protein